MSYINNLSLQGACLCLFSGALLGGLYLGGRLLRLLLGGGRLMEAALDVLFCLCFAVTAFVCALALDKGRLRFIQLALQVLGAWGVTAALDPLVLGAVGLIRRCAAWIRRLVTRILRRLWRPAAAILAKLRDRLRAAAAKYIPKRKPKKRRAGSGKNRGKKRRAAPQPPPSRTSSSRG